MDYKFDSTMNFTTIMLGHKKKQVRLQSEEIYDPFHVFPNLQNVIKKAQVRKSVDSPPDMLTERLSSHGTCFPIKSSTFASWQRRLPNLTTRYSYATCFQKGCLTAQVRKSVDSPPGMLTEDHHHTVHEERQVCYSSHLRPKSLHL